MHTRHMYLSRGAVLLLFTLLIRICCFTWSYKLKTTLHVIMRKRKFDEMSYFSQYVTFFITWHESTVSKLAVALCLHVYGMDYLNVMFKRLIITLT